VLKKLQKLKNKKMSVIGTTLKQPRVFAHDAVALQDLPGCVYAGVKDLDVLTGQGDPGTGFVVDECYETYNETTGGYGAIVQVKTIDAAGEILTVEICEGDCSAGTMYSKGDILTVIWEPKGASTSGTNSTGFIEVDDLNFASWDYGCPFSPMENRILTDDEITINDGNHIVHPIYITSGREYSDLEYIEIRWGRNDHEAETSGEPIWWSWKFEKNQIEADCWNLLVLTPSNFNDSFDPDSELSFGQFITYCRVIVGRVFSENAILSSYAISYKFSTPFMIENPGLAAFGPGKYDFHYTWLYDDAKQESLPFKFNDVDNEISASNHVGGDNSTTFVISTSDEFQIVDDLIGRRLQNLGDARTSNGVSVFSEGFIRDNANNTIQVTDLYHGTNDNFSNGDDIKILPITNNKINIIGGYILFNFDIYNIVKPAIPCSTTASTHLINSTAHGLSTGQTLEFTNSDEGRITDNEIMYVSSQSLTANSFRITTSLANAIAGTSTDLTSSDDASLEYRTYSINKRITGSRIYWKLEDRENYYLIGEQDFIEKGFRWFPSSDKLSYDMESADEQSDNWLKYSSIIKGIAPKSANLIDTFRNINGFDSNVSTLSAKFKTATVSGRRCYIGNIEQNGKKYPDRILKSQINKFDTFPDEVNALDVAVRDGDSIGIIC